jgi:hypothetical protein
MECHQRFIIAELMSALSLEDKSKNKEVKTLSWDIILTLYVDGINLPLYAEMGVECRKVITEVLERHHGYLNEVGYSRLADPAASFKRNSQHTAMNIRAMLHRLFRTSTDIKYPQSCQR